MAAGPAESSGGRLAAYNQWCSAEPSRRRGRRFQRGSHATREANHEQRVEVDASAGKTEVRSVTLDRGLRVAECGRGFCLVDEGFGPSERAFVTRRGHLRFRVQASVAQLDRAPDF